MIAERLLFPCSKLATTRHWHDTTLAQELRVWDATENELSAAMDWLLERQKAIETKLAKRHLTNGGLVLDDVSSSSYELGWQTRLDGGRFPNICAYFRSQQVLKDGQIRKKLMYFRAFPGVSS